ncbi:thiol-disulfide oxidoreductase DCC family protein [Vibrio sagamiensis]|uniref:Redox protein n=1 Tax=Vibrio sagamiensis NBRC 104589 TaxID=1219064 RepID=A0A511QEK9_9VIBR|nr:DUF393 domain-containing protein [Vibrio sagamiensis]PNQ54010.1 DUF393 domain-containing protein [Vibrio agarivorans]GEM75734.1 redox protein [Vibrio sagamiensis NBRC 104589]
MSKLTIFFDGTCPLCVKEMQSLIRRDQKKQIITVDINSDAFAHYPFIDKEKANTILHAITCQGELLLGLDAAHKAWQLVGLGWLYAPLRWWFVKPIADWFYVQFANNRYKISFLLTGSYRCKNGTCSRK